MTRVSPTGHEEKTVQQYLINFRVLSGSTVVWKSDFPKEVLKEL
jgi:hypothetical protein